MSTHFSRYPDDDGPEQAPCGIWIGDASDLSSDWSRVDCKRCLKWKDMIMATHEAEERAIVQQMGDMADYYAGQHPFELLAADHKGMRVDYSGLLKQSVCALRRGVKEPGLAEMLRQLQEHMTELGRRWYSGDTAVVDELLQLYAVEDAARDALKKAQGGDK